MTTRSATQQPQIASPLSLQRGRWRAGIELFVLSFMILFLELACIRWLGSTVIFLTFFTNIVLMAAFLGISVGCLAASRNVSWINGLVPLSMAITVSACGVLWVYTYNDQLVIDVGSQQSPQQVFFGSEARIKDPTKWVVPIEVLAAYFYVLIALLFIGPGQEVGRRFAAINSRLTAYTADILGSLAGIAAFGLTSFFQTPAWVWFLIALALGISFVPRRRLMHGLGALIAIALIGFADWPSGYFGPPAEVYWSPYYQVRFKPRTLFIDVNNMAHQGMVNVDRGAPAYALPHLLNAASGGRPFNQAMIVGAGSGNDVAAALAHGVRHVDAVEIDPVLYNLGKKRHPNRPYDDPRVEVHIDDGRGFLRKTQSRYDLISYALVDSLVLHSNYSSVRLESFLFTEQGFRDVKEALKPGGVFVMYNFYRQGWVVTRLARLAEAVFGSRPIVISLPYRPVISPSESQRDVTTFLVVGNGQSPVIDAIRRKFEREKFFWITSSGDESKATAFFSPVWPRDDAGRITAALKIGPAEVKRPEVDTLPTDDWPFLYLREPVIPALNLRGAALVAVLSIIILLVFAPVRVARPGARMFFLGAGFMLLETRSVVHMALLFGATWMVNSIVFFAILTMILVSNLYVLAVRPVRLWPYYTLLLIALLVNSLVPMDAFLALSDLSKTVLSCAVAFSPIFFAGVIFATAFRASARPDIDFGANIAGIILGGLSENLSLVLGFNHLLWIAMGYYLLSGLLWPREGAANSKNS